MQARNPGGSAVQPRVAMARPRSGSDAPQPQRQIGRRDIPASETATDGAGAMASRIRHSGDVSKAN
jgi:hypothetical protein